MKRNLLFIFLCLAAFTFFDSPVYSQDIIVRSNNDSLRVKIVEMTTDKIRFRYFSVKNGPVLEIPKNQVKEIIYENGTKLTIVYNMYEVSPDLAVHARAHAIKFDVFSPLLNHYTFCYEHQLKLGRNLEIKAALIATNVNVNIKHSEGGFIKAGLKFILLVDSYQKGLKYKDPLKGSYIKPEIIIGRYTTDDNHHKINYNHYAINLVCGKQTVLGTSITLDFSGGIGVGYETDSYVPTSDYDKKEEDFNYAYSHIYFGKKFPFVLSGGITMGYSF